MSESRDFLVPDDDDGPPLECMTCGRDEHDPDIEDWVYQNWNDDHGNRMYKCAECDEPSEEEDEVSNEDAGYHGFEIQWQPGNGTNYHLQITQRGDRVLLCWLYRGGSGGDCMKFGEGSTLHWSYMAEKLDLRNRADIAGILSLVHKAGLANVVMPDGYGLDGLGVEGGPHEDGGAK